MSKVPRFQTSHAILLLSDRYILQLRDDNPDISAPGEWSFFGGMLQKGEKPVDGMRREVLEELGIEPKEYTALWFEDYYDPFESKMVRTWFFVADVSDVWSEHKLTEGRDAKAFAFTELSKMKIPDIMRKTLNHYHNEYKEKRA